MNIIDQIKSEGASITAATRNRFGMMVATGHLSDAQASYGYSLIEATTPKFTRYENEAIAEQKSAKSAAKAEARKAVGFEIGQTVTALDADCDERTGQIVAITRHSHIWVTIEDEHGRCDVQVNEVEEV